MAKPIIMPKVGNTVESCILTKWYVKKGDKVKKGQKLFSYETDKTTIDEKSKYEGEILEVFFQENDEVKVYENVAVIGKKGEKIKEFEPKKIEEKQPKENIKDESKLFDSSNSKQEESTQPSQPTSKILNDFGISPRAIKAIQKSGIPLHAIKKGTGPKGRIIERDIINSLNLASFQSGNISKGKELEKLITPNQNFVDKQKVVFSPMRKAIAKNMMLSLEKSAQTTLTISINANKLLKLRKKFKNEYINGMNPNVSINDLLIFSLSRLLPKYANSINAHVMEDHIIVNKHAHIAIAIDTPNGLIVPVIENANNLTLVDISIKAKDIIKKARANALKELKLNGGSFTLSNVGGMNIEVFTPVLNPPQAAILGVGGISLRPYKDVDSGLIGYYNSMILSLTIDHRALDGADGARFLNDLKNILENIEDLI